MVLIYVLGAFLSSVLIIWLLHKLQIIDALHQDLDRSEVISILESLLDGSDDEWALDDFISVAIKDPELEQVRQGVDDLCEKYFAKRGKPFEEIEWKQGIGELLNELRSKAP